MIDQEQEYEACQFFQVTLDHSFLDHQLPSFSRRSTKNSSIFIYIQPKLSWEGQSTTRQSHRDIDRFLFYLRSDQLQTGFTGFFSTKINLFVRVIIMMKEKLKPEGKKDLVG